MSEPKANQEKWLDQWAERIHHSGLSVVVLPLLEVCQGLGFLAGQTLLLAQPVLAGLIDETSIDRYVTFLEDPTSLESLIERVERKAKGDG
jgi:hypothetical protein